MDTKTLLDAAKDVGKYVLVAFTVYFVGILAHIILGIFTESVVPALGLNTTTTVFSVPLNATVPVTGTAYVAIVSLITAIGTAITAITGIVTVITGLMILAVVLKLFGFKLNFNM